ncbi:MAG: S53 family peptidase [Ktedonobacteraceae bacterium]|nr:S53 family peptidase [Ktedonobacteraceae bacterium]
MPNFIHYVVSNKSGNLFEKTQIKSCTCERNIIVRKRSIVILTICALLALFIAGAVFVPSRISVSAAPAKHYLPACAAALPGQVSCDALVLAPGNTQPNATKHYLPACGAPLAGYASCNAIVLAPSNAQNNAASAPSGYSPKDLQSAYNLPSAGNGQTVAIVDAFDDPNAEADLGVYRSQYGLSACTTANGCFKKVDQNGGNNYPQSDSGWAQEISVDVDMVSAICPKCHILLVEANNNSLDNLTKAVDRAAQLKANVINNSYGGSESPDESSFDSSYAHPGIAITAASGDSGYGVSYPATSPHVTAVGGTSLSRASNKRGWSETAWSGAGSGCSGVFSKPSWQKDSGCNMRTIADVSADADPNTGVAVYDSFASNGTSSWLIFGGTSVATAIISGVYALAGNASKINDASYAYSHTSSLNDVTSGSNGDCGNYLCNAGPGYDGPTGLGTPNGTGAF